MFLRQRKGRALRYKDERLFVAEGFDGVKTGGFDGGVHAEEEADAHGDGDGENDGPERDGRGERGNSEVDEQADGAAKENANDAAGTGEDDGFGEELPDDVALARANGAAHANFAGALSDGHEHDVHHTDAADEEADGADDGDEQGDRGSDLAKLVGDLLGAGDAEIIGLVVGNVAAAAEDAANLVFGFGHVSVNGGGADHDFVVLGIVFAVGAIGNQDVFIGGLILDELAFARLEDADDFVSDGVHQDGLADGLVIGVKRFGDVRADDGDIGAVSIFGIAKEAALPRAGVEDFLVGGKGAVVVNAGDFFAEIAGGDNTAGRAVFLKAREDAGADSTDGGAELLDSFGVFEDERAAGAFIRGETAGVDAGIETEDEQGVRAVVAEVGVHIAVDADEDGDDGEERGDADDNAEDGEERTHFIFAQGVEGHLSVFTDVHAHGGGTLSYISWRRASMGCSEAALRAG